MSLNTCLICAASDTLLANSMPLTLTQTKMNMNMNMRDQMQIIKLIIEHIYIENDKMTRKQSSTNYHQTNQVLFYFYI